MLNLQVYLRLICDIRMQAIGYGLTNHVHQLHRPNNLYKVHH